MTRIDNWNALFRKKRRPEPGTPPGTITVDKHVPAESIHLISYDEAEVNECDLNTVNELKTLIEKHNNKVHWIDVQGLGNEEYIRELGNLFEIHPLALEDIVNVPQIPKADQLKDQLFVVTRMLMFSVPQVLSSEQVSIFLGKNYVLSFQENPGDCLETLRRRIREGRGIIRHMGADYLCYAIVDTLVDNYFPVVEALGEKFESLEEEIVSGSNSTPLASFYNLKHETVAFRRLIWQMRAAVGALMRKESGLINQETIPFFRDCYDHLIHMIDITETYRELQAEIMNIYLTSASNRMNEIMKVLTIIATIFIPLSFIAGIYGMNFAHMPELQNKYAYFIVLSAMIAAGLMMLMAFWRKGWLNRSNTPPSYKKKVRREDDD